jgi:hypothetical protein
MTRLSDTPAGVLTIALANAVQDLSLLFVGTPDARALAALDDYCASIRADLCEAIGADKADMVISTLRDAVLRRKRQIEGRTC